MSAYYNEHDPKAAEWIRELIKAGVIAPGDVDTRDIQQVSPHDLHGYTQCHFFAGVGVWSYALRRAGWPDDRPVWTGSCPCQPFSAAGKQLGEKDPRHLWPRFYDLIAFCAPPVVFGEQVAGAKGVQWLAGVRADLEGMGYAVGAADLCAASAGPEAEGWIVRGDQAGWERIVNGSPNIRQRLYWMAHAQGQGRARVVAKREAGIGERSRSGRDRAAGRQAHADGGQSGHGGVQPSGQHGQQPEDGGVAGRVANSADERGTQYEHGSGGWSAPGPNHSSECAGACGLRNAGGEGLAASECQELPGARRGGEGRAAQQPGRASGFWGSFDLVHCTDGKARRIEPGSFPLAHGVAGRVGLLRGYGNAINAELATEWVEVCSEELSA